MGWRLGQIVLVYQRLYWRTGLRVVISEQSGVDSGLAINVWMRRLDILLCRTSCCYHLFVGNVDCMSVSYVGSLLIQTLCLHFLTHNV